ncbi:hypothetical protein ACFQ0B_79695 [Nonomuraea thailandensis]
MPTRNAHDAADLVQEALIRLGGFLPAPWSGIADDPGQGGDIDAIFALMSGLGSRDTAQPPPAATAQVDRARWSSRNRSTESPGRPVTASRMPSTSWDGRGLAPGDLLHGW